MSPRILFLVNGLGLGNSTRSAAVMARLRQAGAEIEVATSGNGLWFFDGAADLGAVTAMPSLAYGAREGRLSVARTLAGMGEMRRVLARTDAIVADRLARFRPQAVVADSVYGLGAVRRAGVPLAAINNADMVMRAMGRWRDWPASVLPQFLAIECADRLFHRWVPDLTISPRLDPDDRAEGRRLRRVGLIVRAGYDSQPVSERPPTRVVAMLSGSVFGSPVRLEAPPPGVTVAVLGRPAPTEGPPPPGIVYHGKVRETLAPMREADLLVVNGGSSAVSEALALRKPVVVVPVPRHAEQWVNGRIAAHLGVGLLATEEGLDAAIRTALARIEAMRAACRRLCQDGNGAERAAAMILDLARTGGRR